MKGGFSESPLRLKSRLAKLEQWDEDAIKARAKSLSKVAACGLVCSSIDIICIGDLSRANGISVRLFNRRPPQSSQRGIGRVLFCAFRKEVLALDPVVNEEFLKLYVA